MSNHDPRGDQIRASVSGDVSGQVAVGKDIKQTRTTSPDSTQGKGEDQERVFADLRRMVENEAPPEERQSALDRLDTLEEAISSDPPNADAIQDIVSWFATHLPEMAEAVGEAGQP